MSKITEAVRRVVQRCHEANPYHMQIPASGATAMTWLLEELERLAPSTPTNSAEAWKSPTDPNIICPGKDLTSVFPEEEP